MFRVQRIRGSSFFRCLHVCQGLLRASSPQHTAEELARRKDYDRDGAEAHRRRVRGSLGYGERSSQGTPKWTVRGLQREEPFDIYSVHTCRSVSYDREPLMSGRTILRIRRLASAIRNFLRELFDGSHRHFKNEQDKINTNEQRQL